MVVWDGTLGQKSNRLCGASFGAPQRNWSRKGIGRHSKVNWATTINHDPAAKNQIAPKARQKETNRKKKGKLGEKSRGQKGGQPFEERKVKEGEG